MNSSAHWLLPSSRKMQSNVVSLRLFFCLLGMCIAFLANAQERILKGTVSSQQDGLPIPGVNVLVRGTYVGTATDHEGKYSLNIPSSGAFLVFSFIGHKTVEVSIGDHSIIDVPLAPEITQLSEVVVTGTGVPTEKRKLAFAVESVSAENLPMVPTASIDQALVGRIPGALISSMTGTPGSDVSILLRGINTINRGTMPMVLIDGMQMGATTLSSLDPASIERVEVVQGAAAATIYGAQGANGVIQIFTKKGRTGKLKIDFTSSLAVNEFLNIGGLRKAKYHGFTTNANNEVINPGNDEVITQDPTTLLYNGTPGYSPLNPATQINKPYDQNFRYYDHFNMFLRPANIYHNSLSIAGGSENTDYAITVSNNHHTSNFEGEGYNNRTNLMTNLGFTLARGLKLRSVTQLITTKNTISIGEKQMYGTGYNAFLLFNTYPVANYELKDTDGNYGAAYGLAAGISGFNPFYIHQYSTSDEKILDVVQNFDLTYALPKYVSLQLQYGINNRNSNFRNTILNQTLNANSVEGFSWWSWFNFNNTGEIDVFENSRTFQNLKANAIVNLDFQKDFSWKLPLRSTTQLTYDYRDDDSRRFTAYALGMPVTPPLTASQGTTFNIQEDYREEFVTFGYLVNQRFEFGEVAGISAGFRTDYSSAFGKGSEPFTFPRADAFFRISGLNFWDQSKILNAILEWKVRAAYGEAGIQPLPFDRYITLTPRTIGTSSMLFFGIDQANPDLSVEVSKEFEVGTDMTFGGLSGNWFRNIQVSFTYWTRKTENAILDVDAAPSTGIGRIKDNALSLAADGIQASVNASVLKNQRFVWNLTANFSTQKSVIDHVTGDRIILGDNVLEAGQQVGQFYGWLMLRSVDQRKPDGQPFIDLAQQENYEVASNGWVVNKATKQPYISPDRYSLGDPNPDFMMSFINDLTYKNFLTFSFQLDWIEGARLYNYTKQWMYRDGIHSDYEEPITINGETGAWAAFYRGAYTPATWNKNYFVEDASFVRLRNVAVGVDFARLFSFQKLTRLQVLLSGRNLWTKTGYSGMDPEISTYGQFTSTLARGRDDSSMPNFRTYQVTLNIGF